MGKIVSIVLFFFLLFPGFAFSQTAGLLPNGVQQYFDNDGNPLSSGTVDFYIVGTSTRKNTWQNSGETVLNTNPVVLNSAGRAIIYGEGSYRQVLKDILGNTIWDAVTTASGAGGGGSTATGDGDLVGTVKPWAGIVAPNQYAFAYGQELSRTTFVTLMTAITQTTNVVCSNASNTLSGLSNTEQIKIGAVVEVICMAAGTTVVSKTASTITMSNPASISINTVAVVFNFGNGNGSTTFNVPDLRGNVLAGRPNMGGSASSNLTSVGCTTPASGATCGTQTHLLLAGELAQHTHTGTYANTGTINGTSITNNNVNQGVGTVSVDLTGGTATLGANFTQASSTTTHLAGAITVSGTSDVTPVAATTAFAIVQPTMLFNYIIKTTPDTNAATASGVTSIQSMTGDIACGTGLTCTGNIISLTSGTAGGADTQVQFNNAGLFAGSANLTWVNPTLTIGAASSATGILAIKGTTSGTVTQTVQAAAGTPTITWGTGSGTPAISVSAPLSLSTATGALSITGAAGQVLAGATPAFTATPTLGASGTLGSLTLGNATSGLVTLQPVAGALGTVTISIPAAAGTMAVSVSSPLTLNATTGALACATCVTASSGGAITGTSPIAVSAAGVVSINAPYTSLTASNGGIVYSGVTNLAILSGTATASLPLLSGSSAAPTWATVSHPTSATSGGIAYFSSTTVMASSALLAANQLVLGGGAGTTPATLGSLGTTTTLLHGNAGGAPTFGAVVSADLNITTTSCTNQFVTAISAGGVGTCTTATLASAQFANQGTTTTVLHGNAAGNPSFAAVSLSAGGDVTGNLPNANLASQTANTVLGALTATTPSGLAVPSCSTAASALTWTSGTGFGCNTISGSGTVNSGTAGQMAYYATSTTAVSGNTNANISNGALTLGVATSVIGQLKLAGNTSGTVTITPAAAAGTWTMTLPTTAGSNTFFLQTDGTGVTTWASAAGSGTVTSAQIIGAGLTVNSGTCTITTTGVCTLTTTAATQANQETATSTTTAVTPSVQQYHPSAVKVWMRLDGKTGATCAVTAQYPAGGSCTRIAAGRYTVTFGATFSAATAVGCNVSAFAVNVQTVIPYFSAAPTATGFNELRTQDTNFAAPSNIDSDYIVITCMGDL